MKNELEGKIMTKFLELRAKAYSHIIVRMEKKKAQKNVQKKKKKISISNCFEATQLENKINYLEKN